MSNRSASSTGREASARNFHLAEAAANGAAQAAVVPAGSLDLNVPVALSFIRARVAQRRSQAVSAGRVLDAAGGIRVAGFCRQSPAGQRS
jgi:hypothetical protein